MSKSKQITENPPLADKINQKTPEKLYPFAENYLKNAGGDQPYADAMNQAIDDYSEADKAVHQWMEDNKDAWNELQALYKKRRESESAVYGLGAKAIADGVISAEIVDTEADGDGREVAHDAFWLPDKVGFKPKAKLVYDPAALWAWCAQFDATLLQVNEQAIESRIKWWNKRGKGKRTKNELPPLMPPVELVESILPTVGNINHVPEVNSEPTVESDFRIDFTGFSTEDKRMFSITRIEDDVIVERDLTYPNAKIWVWKKDKEKAEALAEAEAAAQDS